MRIVRSDHLHLINVFAAVVDAKSFAGAARALNLSPPAVTRAIAALEKHLGVRLLTRTTRVTQITEAGFRYAEDCRRILKALTEADASVGELGGLPRGDLLVAAPVQFGAQFIVPIVNEYLLRYPEISVTCWFVDRIVNMADGNLDIALNIGSLHDSSAAAIHVGRARTVICGAPRYLKQHGVPRTPDELRQHVVICANSSTSTFQWQFVREGAPCIVKLQPRLITTTDDSAVAAAVGGFGLTQLLSFQVAEQLRVGQLTTVLSEFEPAALPIYVTHREAQHSSQSARVLLDLAVERLRANPDLT